MGMFQDLWLICVFSQISLICLKLQVSSNLQYLSQTPPINSAPLAERTREAQGIKMSCVKKPTQNKYNYNLSLLFTMA